MAIRWWTICLAAVQRAHPTRRKSAIVLWAHHCSRCQWRRHRPEVPKKKNHRNEETAESGNSWLLLRRLFLSWHSLANCSTGRGNVAADASSPATGKMNVPWPVDNPLLLDWTDQRLYGSKCGRPLNLRNVFECWLIEQPLDGNIKCIVSRPVGEKMRRSPFLYLEHPLDILRFLERYLLKWYRYPEEIQLVAIILSNHREK